MSMDLEELMKTPRPFRINQQSLRVHLNSPRNKGKFFSVPLETERSFDLTECFVVIGADSSEVRKEVEQSDQKNTLVPPRVLQKVCFSEYGQKIDQYCP